ncbi:MAG TPA: helical backbone metal receptor [Candidatus Polarisedimenticolia bacterium]|nr:helical backbone metal receptor [Candidatus Polarisedimenticolia bacterium]
MPLFALSLMLFLAPASGQAGDLPAPRPEKLVRDGIGRPVRIPSPVSRIVSMAPSVTETLFALGRGDRVVGVTDFCNQPPAALRKARIGGMVNPSWETIMSLDPDLLIATTSGNDASTIARADSLHLPVYFLDTPDLDSMLASLIPLGWILDAPDRARTLHAELVRRLARLEARARQRPRTRVLFLVWNDPIVVPGHGTFLDDALRRCGCDSITSDAPTEWPTFDLETLMIRNPRWILASSQNAAFLQSLREKPGWREMEAVRYGRVATVSEAMERPAPRVVEAMEELTDLLEKGAQ